MVVICAPLIMSLKIKKALAIYIMLFMNVIKHGGGE